MLAAVHLHNEPEFTAGEVYDEWSDRLLANELVTIDRARAETIPQLAFGVSRLVTQAAGTRCLDVVCTTHGSVFELRGS
jgi:hypothetical protein